MYQTSNRYKEVNSEPIRSFESEIMIGNRKITNENLTSFVIQQSMQQDDTFSIGNTISSCLSLMFLHDDIDTDDKDIVNLKLGLLVDGVYEYIPLGVYNIYSIDSNDTTTTLLCYDNMAKFDILYTENNENPTVYSVINRLIELTGIKFGGTLSNYKDYELTILQGSSCREVLGYVAGVLGSNAIIDRAGKFDFVSISTNPIYAIERFELISKDGSVIMTKDSEVVEVKAQVGFVSANNYYDYTKKNKSYKIKQVVNNTDSDGLVIGNTDDESVCLYMQNPFVNEEIIQDIYNKINGLEFLPYSLNWVGDVSIDLGDLITVTDKKDVMRCHPVLSQTITYNGALNVICNAQGDTKLANTYIVKTKEESEIDKVKDDLNNTVVSVEVMYYQSESKTELIGGEWTSEAPEWTEDLYIWSKTVTEYKNGDIVESEPVCITGQQGLQGVQGEKGDQGIPGTTYYTWIKYADDELGNGLSDSPDNKTYIGFAYNKTTPIESDNKSDYTWSRIQGEKGDTGVKGQDGADGKTYYTWIKYSDNANGNPCYDTPTSSTQYIGIAVNQITATESSDYTKYTWSKFKGDQGVKGETGADGKTSYFHIKYSAVANPTSSSQMTETPSTYIGTYVDYIEMDSDDPKKYTWARFEGLQGAKGEQGIPGVNGDDGQTSYLHIKYSNDGGKTFTGNNGEDVGIYIGTCTDFNLNDPTTVSAYKWALIKGEDGLDGEDGVSVEEVIIQYSKNKSTTTPPTDGWDSSMPSYQEGYYLWMRTRVKYSDNSNYEYSTPVCDQSWKVNAETYTQYKQLQDKFTWIVKSGTSESNMTLTDTLYSLITENIKLKAKNISLEGLVTANNNFKINLDGSIEAVNGKFTGNISGSNITGSSITSTSKTDASIKATIDNGNISIVSKDIINGNDTQNIAMSIGNGGIIIGDTKIANGYMYSPSPFIMDFPIETDYNIISNSNIQSGQHIRAGNELQVLNPSSGGWVRIAVYNSSGDYLHYGLPSSNVLLQGSPLNLKGTTLRLGCGDASIIGSSTHAGIVHFTSYDSGSGTKVYAFRPTTTNATLLGSASNRWQTIYSVNSLSVSSDRNAKENIKYVQDDNISTLSVEDTSNITLDGLYNFVKDDLFLTTFNYKENNKKTLGFIAQDMLQAGVYSDESYNIANTIIEVDEENNLSYDTGAYINTLAGALKKAIDKIEQLENKIEQLEYKISKMEV